MGAGVERLVKALRGQHSRGGGKPLLDKVTLFCFMTLRVERWGELWRVIAFKGSPVRKPKKLEADNKIKGDRKIDEGYFWEAQWYDEEQRENGRFDSSVARARSRVRELAFCQQWDYFVTLTLSSEKQDRFDIKQWVKDLGNWIGNYNKKYGVKLQYLIIPEQHKNGAWHAHGLLRGVAKNSVTINEYGYYDMPYYVQRFGYINMSQIRDNKKTASYITKYISKSSDSTARVLDGGAHLFYASRGLAGKEIVWQGCGDFDGGWESKWCKVKFTDFDEVAKIMKEGFEHENEVLSNHCGHEGSDNPASELVDGKGGGRCREASERERGMETIEEVSQSLHRADGALYNSPVGDVRRRMNAVALCTSPRKAREWTTDEFDLARDEFTFFGK